MRENGLIVYNRIPRASRRLLPKAAARSTDGPRKVPLDLILVHSVKSLDSITYIKEEGV